VDQIILGFCGKVLVEGVLQGDTSEEGPRAARARHSWLQQTHHRAQPSLPAKLVLPLGQFVKGRAKCQIGRGTGGKKRSKSGEETVDVP